MRVGKGVVSAFKNQGSGVGNEFGRSGCLLDDGSVPLKRGLEGEIGEGARDAPTSAGVPSAWSESPPVQSPQGNHVSVSRPSGRSLLSRRNLCPQARGCGVAGEAVLPEPKAIVLSMRLVDGNGYGN